MKTIYKYLISRNLGRQDIAMPDLSKVVSVGLDGEGNLAMWAEVDTQMPKVNRSFYCVWTGVDLEAMLKKFMKIIFHGTIVDENGLVYHIYEVSYEVN